MNDLRFINYDSGSATNYGFIDFFGDDSTLKNFNEPV